MNWLTTNNTFDYLAADYLLTRSPCLRMVKATLAALYEVLDEVSWVKKAWHEEEYVAPEGNLFHGVTFVLDGIECGIAKPSDREEETLWYSHKAGFHSVKYETCVHVSSGRLMWIAGGVPGSIHDIRLTKQLGLLDTIPRGEKGLADKGYVGLDYETFLVPVKLHHKQDDGDDVGNAGRNNRQVRGLKVEERVYNRALSAIRIIVER